MILPANYTSTIRNIDSSIVIAGKAVMCEKPLSFSLKAIVDCYQTAEEKAKHLFCAFNRRYGETKVLFCLPELVAEWLRLWLSNLKERVPIPVTSYQRL